VRGLEGFNLDGAEVVPLLDVMADFGSVVGDWATQVELCAAAAREVRAHWQPAPDLIEVTLDGIEAKGSKGVDLESCSAAVNRVIDPARKEEACRRTV